MSIFDIFKRRESPLDIEVREIRARFRDIALDRSHQEKIIPGLAMELTAELCDIKSKKPNPDDFIDIALVLCGQQPEFGALILSKYDEYNSRLRFSARPLIMSAIAKIPTLPVETIMHYSKQHKYTIDRSKIDDSVYRTKIAGQLLSRALFISANNIKEVHDLYRASMNNSTIIVSTIIELNTFASPELVEAILK